MRLGDQYFIQPAICKHKGSTHPKLNVMPINMYILAINALRSGFYAKLCKHTYRRSNVTSQ